MRPISVIARSLPLLAVCLLPALARESPFFFARGHVSSSSKHPKTGLAAPPQLFEVRVTGCTWRIDFPGEPGSKSPFDAQTVEFDGTNCIARTLFKMDSKSAKAVNDAAAEVEGGPVPNPSAPKYTGHIWMALCSGCYFKTNAPGRAAPFWTLNTLVESERYHPPAVWELAGKPPYTPSKITCYVDDTIDFQSATFAEDLRVIVGGRLPPRIDERRLWGRFEVTSYMSHLDGLEIPKEFECQMFNPVPPGTGGGTTPERAYLIKGVIEDAGLLEPGPGLADERLKNAKYVIDDFRSGISGAHGRIPVQYESKGGLPAPTNSDAWIVAEERARAIAAAPPAVEERKGGLRLMFIAALGTLSTVIILVLMASKNKH